MSGSEWPETRAQSDLDTAIWKARRAQELLSDVAAFLSPPSLSRFHGPRRGFIGDFGLLLAERGIKAAVTYLTDLRRHQPKKVTT